MIVVLAEMALEQNLCQIDVKHSLELMERPHFLEMTAALHRLLQTAGVEYTSWLAHWKHRAERRACFHGRYFQKRFRMEHYHAGYLNWQ